MNAAAELDEHADCPHCGEPIPPDTGMCDLCAGPDEDDARDQRIDDEIERRL